MQKGFIVHTVIVNEKGEILILQRSKNNDVLPEYWDIPGGTLEEGEEASDGAIREVKEETGLLIFNPKFFFQKSNIDTAKNKEFITLIFHAAVSNVEVRLNPEEHQAYAWVNISDIAKYKTVDYMAPCIRAYSEAFC